MKIKEIEPYLPKYSDGSGYDVINTFNYYLSGRAL